MFLLIHLASESETSNIDFNLPYCNQLNAEMGECKLSIDTEGLND